MAIGDNQRTPISVYLAKAPGPDGLSCITSWQELAGLDRIGRHTLVDDAERADVILFPDAHLTTDWRLTEIRSSPLMDRFPDKCYVYDERDRPWCALPGLYASMPGRRFHGAWQRAVPYYRIDEPTPAETTEPDLLFSFVASPTHPCRLPLFELDDPRGLVDRADGFTFYDSASRGFDDRKNLYSSALQRSKFVLCPRGTGTSSIRLYEVCASGRVPVIISDDWVAPSGPSWSDFALSWPEQRTSGLGEFLRSHEAESSERGAAARVAYEEWFGPSVAFDRLASHLADLVHRRPGAFPRNGIRDAQFRSVGTFETRRRVRSMAKRLLHR